MPYSPRSDRRLLLLPRARALALILPLLAACHEEKSTILVVNLAAWDNAVATAANLKATFQQGEEKLDETLTNEAGTITFPASFVIRADGWEGDVEVSVQAQDESGKLVGEGTARASLVPLERVDQELILYPADFEVSSTNGRGKTFADYTTSSWRGFGRELAATDNGFIAVWRDSLCDTQHCDLYYRLFDSFGKPVLVSGTSGEHVANEPRTGSAQLDMPAIAAQPDGRFVVAFQRTGPLGKSVKSRPFTATGLPATAETDLGSTTAASIPAVAALRDGGYVVVWQEQASGSWWVKGRYLGQDGSPAPLHDGTNQAFAVTPGFGGSVEPAPTVAAGMNQGFMVVWNENGTVKGRPYGPKARPLREALAVSQQGGTAFEANVAPLIALKGGYAIAWSQQGVCAPDNAGSCIRLQRLLPDGEKYQAKELDFTLNTATTGSQRYPALAVREDGSLLVAWSTDDKGTDPGGGIRGRRVLSNFLPVGVEFSINTTQNGQQTTPALARRLKDDFVVAFVDFSPGPSLPSIRGRVLYPDYRASDGLLGALCDPRAQDSCRTDLSCQPTETGTRCVAKCPTGLCPAGGACKKLSGSGEDVCLYNN